MSLRGGWATFLTYIHHPKNKMGKEIIDPLVYSRSHEIENEDGKLIT